ncbi:MAG: hypothetical protein ABF679_08180 [Lentilactobacillus diolivorans]|mgnify:CR=1 FL=1|jgi:hypothetical protein|uniref:Uncharacterized protein n=2 Tax=Lentilactobacillus diolivorans TaxID=179838 RepID=A0A0R1SQH3_9LACO|nr:hypothetical protein [Lentilactobacillus diolivorans]RRG03900.1 MAG: hypothetical protein DUD34_03160 [Lactobacillus sp.]KRL69988.1 hypothetical protein FC85_GL000017 [Lentilactobacillus diolivorans DSM 14421]MCH4164017.1 hypothetical protein [Lentilactobacillus diolivorans]MDH5105592.1 hypothetical protein [Lentilactobacillus diolivorans]GEP24505.1 hypothetical protein LDI01_20980 [Lentilactobacillus diolivorans]
MTFKRLFYALIFGLLNVGALILLVDPIMAIVNQNFQETDLIRIIIIVALTLILDVGVVQEIQN